MAMSIVHFIHRLLKKNTDILERWFYALSTCKYTNHEFYVRLQFMFYGTYMLLIIKRCCVLKKTRAL